MNNLLDEFLLKLIEDLKIKLLDEFILSFVNNIDNKKYIEDFFGYYYSPNSDLIRGEIRINAIVIEKDMSDVIIRIEEAPFDKYNYTIGTSISKDPLCLTTINVLSMIKQYSELGEIYNILKKFIYRFWNEFVNLINKNNNMDILKKLRFPLKEINRIYRFR